MNRGHVSKRTDITWNTAATRLVFAFERGRQLLGAFLWGFPRLHAQVWQDRGGSLLETVLLTGLFIFPNSWKFCKSCFCPLLFKCFWQKGKWKSIFKCILHFFCCCPLCSPLCADNELTDVLGSQGSLSPRGTRAAAPRPGRARSPREGPACPSSMSFQPVAPSQSAHCTRQDLTSPSILHLRHLCYVLAPKHAWGREGFTPSPSPTACPFLSQDRLAPQDVLAGCLACGGAGVGTQRWLALLTPSPRSFPLGKWTQLRNSWKSGSVCRLPVRKSLTEGERGEKARAFQIPHATTATAYWCKKKMLNNSDIFKCFKFLHCESVVFSTLIRGLVTDCRSGDGLRKLCN